MITINRADHLMVVLPDAARAESDEWVEFDIDQEDWPDIIQSATDSGKFVIVYLNGIRYLRKVLNGFS